MQSLKQYRLSVFVLTLLVLLLSSQPLFSISTNSTVSLHGVYDNTATNCDTVRVVINSYWRGTEDDLPGSSFDKYAVTLKDANGVPLWAGGGTAIVGMNYYDDDWMLNLGTLNAVTKRPLTVTMWDTGWYSGVTGINLYNLAVASEYIYSFTFDPGLYTAFCADIPVEFGAPVQTAPKSLVQGSVTYTWNSVATATWYYVWVTNANGHFLDQWVEAVNVCTALVCNFTPSAAYSTGDYQWWAQAWSPTNGYSPWSAGLAFFYGTLNTPTPLAPIGVIESTTPAFQWTQEPGLTWYNIWVSFPNGGGAEYWYEAWSICAGGVCSAQPLMLDEGIYTWWVRGWGWNTYTGWSGANYFQLPLAQVVPTAPSGTISDPDPYFVWNEAPSAYWYYLWVSSDPTGAIMDQWYNAYDICAEGYCGVWESLGLAPGDYVFWVQPWSPVAGYGAWSAPTYFTVSPPAPIAVDAAPTDETPAADAGS